MKRTSSLKAKTGLSRKAPLKGASELKRTELARGTTRMKPRSDKTAKKYREERIPFVKRILAERPLCQACPVYAALEEGVGFVHRPSVDVHEILSRGRSGGVHGDAWLDDANVLSLCRICHDRIGRNVAEAERLGLLRSNAVGDA